MRGKFCEKCLILLMAMSLVCMSLSILLAMLVLKNCGYLACLCLNFSML
jgi:hypothetical protein